MSQAKPSNPLIGIGIFLLIVVAVFGIGRELWTRYVVTGKMWPAADATSSLSTEVQTGVQEVVKPDGLHTMAPVGKWGAKIGVLGHYFLYAEGPITLRTSDGREIETDKDEKRDIGIGSTSSLQFRSRTQQAINVFISPTLLPPPFTGSVYRFDLIAPTDEYTDIIQIPSCCGLHFDATGKTATLINEKEKMLATPQNKDEVWPDFGGWKTIRFRSLERTSLPIHMTFRSFFPDRIRDNPVFEALGREQMRPFALLVRPDKWSDYVGIPYDSSIEWKQEKDLPFQAIDENGKNIRAGMADGSTFRRVRFIALTEDPIDLTVTVNSNSPGR